LKAIKLICNNRNRFRLGSFDLGHTTDYLHSDTLFSSIINSISILHNKDTASKYVNLFKTKKINISSAFYLLELYKNNQLKHRIPFFPKVYGRIKSNSSSERTLNKKKIKKLKFFSLNVLKQFLNSTKVDNNEIIFTTDLNNFPALNQEFLITDDELRKIQEIGVKNPESLKIFET